MRPRPVAGRDHLRVEEQVPGGEGGTAQDGHPDALRRAAECFAVALADLVDEPPEAVAAGLTPAADFFALGGHSLLVVTMLRRIERQDGTVLSAREFLADPTVAGLARLLAAPPRVAAAPPTGRSPSPSRSWPPPA